jgi:hypothetical protein
MTATENLSPRFSACEARLRLAGATCATISDGGSRYFNYGRDLKIRVADHPSGDGGFWHQEIRVDQPDWQRQLDALLGPVRMGAVDMPATVYFGDHSAVSQSMLKTFADRRRLYEGYYVTGAIPQPEDNDPMRKGTATHTALLEPHRFNRIVVTFPPDLLASNGAVSTKAAKDFRAEHEAAGCVVLKESEAAKVRAMADSVRRVCSDWFELESMRERAIYWTDEVTGLPCKMRLDWLIQTGVRPVLLDLKTTSDASPPAFRKRIEGNGYWRQHAHYIDGAEAAIGETPLFYFLVVEDSWPFACTLYELDDTSASDARMQRNAEMESLAHCIETNDFSEPWERLVNPVALSRYCFDSER